jgi:hypothetical protein
MSAHVPRGRTVYQIRRRNSLAAMLIAVAILVWFVGLDRSSRSLMLGPAARDLELTAIVDVVSIPIIVLFSVHGALNVFTFLRPVWTPLVGIARVAVHAAALGVLVMLLRSDGLVAARPGAALGLESSAPLVERVNAAARIGLSLVVMAKVVHIALEVTTLRRRRGTAAGSARAAG